MRAWLLLLLAWGTALPAAEFPSPALQQASLGPYAQAEVDGHPLVRWLAAHQIFLLNRVHLLPDGAVASGAGFACATAVSADGYLLTAGHAAVPPLRCARLLHGRWEQAAAALVWNGAPTCDLALVHVPWTTEPLRWASRPRLHPGAMLLLAGTAMASQGSHGWFAPDAAAGPLTSFPEPLAGSEVPVAALVAALPAHPGDSGGSVVTMRGDLAGILVAHLLRPDGRSSGTSTVLRPDPEAIEQRIAADRAAHAAPGDPGLAAVLATPLRSAQR